LDRFTDSHASFATSTQFTPSSGRIDGLRGTLIGKTHFGLLPDLAVLLIVAVALLSVGSYLFTQKIEV
jgi:hypothetical protein